MTDSPWQSPSGSGPQPPGGSGGPPVPPPPPPPAGGPAWTPPPRPGLIPLAPLGLGAILGASFRVLRRNPRPVVGFSLIIHVIIAILTIVVTGFLTAAALNQYFTQISAGNVSSSTFTDLIPSYAADLAVGLIGYVGDAILQGIITMEVARGTVGEKLPLSALWAKARGRILVLVGWGFLVILAVLVGFAIYFGIVALLFGFAGTAGAIIGGIVLGLGVLVAIAIWIWIGTKISLVPSVLVLERRTLGKAIVRSWSLTTGNFFFWRTFGIEILVSVMLAFAASIISSPVTVIVELVSAIGNPVGLESGSGVGAVFSATLIASAIVGAITGTITAIIMTATTSLIYIDLRIRKEGLDLDLMKFVDARAAGATDVADPYLPHDRPAA